MNRRILIAGIGNIFFGDDAFGVEVVRRLMARKPSEGVQVTDFGIRGFDLAYALMDGYDLSILVDATPRHGVPGTLYLIEPQIGGPAKPPLAGGQPVMDPHDLNPLKVLELVLALGGEMKRVLVLGCEPDPEHLDGIGLSPTVGAAADEAVGAVEALIAGFQSGRLVGSLESHRELVKLRMEGDADENVS